MKAETAVAATPLVRLFSESGGPPIAAEETSVAMRILSIIMLSVSMIAFFVLSVRDELIQANCECRAGWRGAGEGAS